MLPNTGNMHIEKVDRETKAIKSAPKEGDYQWLSLMVPRQFSKDPKEREWKARGGEGQHQDS